MKRRLRDYQTGCELLKKIEKIKVFEELQKIYKHGEKFPYNPLILVCLLQSAEKFGKVHGCNALKGKPTVQQTALARQTGASWIMGLDTFYFILPGKNDLIISVLTCNHNSPLNQAHGRFGATPS